MKRFAVILIIAVLALGCVFAATNTKDAPNSGDKFVVTTTIKTIYPVYQIVGTGNNSDKATSADSTSESVEEVEGIVSEDGDTLTINVALQHFGKPSNDMGQTSFAAIRYKNKITVKISAGKLVNQTTGAGHISESGDAVNGAFTGIGTANDNFNSDSVTSTGKSYVEIDCHYNNGLKVAVDSTGKSGVVETIATGSFSWDISKLTAGDTYKADVIVTYTVE